MRVEVRPDPGEGGVDDGVAGAQQERCVVLYRSGVGGGLEAASGGLVEAMVLGQRRGVHGVGEPVEQAPDDGVSGLETAGVIRAFGNSEVFAHAGADGPMVVYIQQFRDLRRFPVPFGLLPRQLDHLGLAGQPAALAPLRLVIIVLGLVGGSSFGTRRVVLPEVIDIRLDLDETPGRLEPLAHETYLSLQVRKALLQLDHELFRLGRHLVPIGKV
ncbi:hypothetical protein [Streptomyces sp. NPDC007929]|uniref:hypothetical protein n=1 Tax=unclassified Streptomyces TaxID=2593676 RepID=UPI0036ED47C2